MARKKWTAKEEVTAEDKKGRIKRKWQQALRRYILESNVSEHYAEYFGLDIEMMRKWIETQFTTDLNWDNFGEAWQFEHVLPLIYFDFDKEEDLRLGWNFINIRVEQLNGPVNTSGRIDILSVKSYFQYLFSETKLEVCATMIDKINLIKSSKDFLNPDQVSFINSNKEDIVSFSNLNSDDYARINRGATLKDVLLEKDILKKFG